MTNTIRTFAVSVIRDMLPTGADDGVDLDSDAYWTLLRQRTDGEVFPVTAVDREVRACLKIIGSGRLNSEL